MFSEVALGQKTNKITADLDAKKEKKRKEKWLTLAVIVFLELHLLQQPIEVKKWLKANKKKGMIRFYGCPAEEGGSGKAYLVSKDANAALPWHPSDANDANPGSALANKSAKFRFHVIASHAGMA